MANIIINDDLSVRTTSYDLHKSYPIAELDFFIPVKYSNFKLYVIIKDQNDIIDICDLRYTNTHGNYSCCNISPTQCLRIVTGKSTLYIVLLNIETREIYLTKDVQADIQVEFHKLSHKIYALNELTSEIGTMYEKIVQMSDVNVDIYEKIQGMAGDENDN